MIQADWNGISIWRCPTGLLGMPLQVVQIQKGSRANSLQWSWNHPISSSVERRVLVKETLCLGCLQTVRQKSCFLQNLHCHYRAKRTVQRSSGKTDGSAEHCLLASEWRSKGGSTKDGIKEDSVCMVKKECLVEVWCW